MVFVLELIIFRESRLHFCLLQRHVKTSENIQNATNRQLAALSTTWCVNRSGRCAVGAMGAHWYCPESARLIFM